MLLVLWMSLLLALLWVNLGGYCDIEPSDVNICLRSALECYYRRTATLKLSSDPAMFLGAYPDHYGIYHGLSADRIRNVILYIY